MLSSYLVEGFHGFIVNLVLQRFSSVYLQRLEPSIKRLEKSEVAIQNVIEVEPFIVDFVDEEVADLQNYELHFFAI